MIKQKCQVQGQEGGWDNIMLAFGIAMGFFLPISSFLTNLCLGAVFLLALRPSYVNRMRMCLRDTPALWPSLFLLGFLVLGALYSVGDWLEISKSLKKDMKYLSLCLLCPLFLDPKSRQAAYWAFMSAFVLTVVLGLMDKMGLPMVPKERFHTEAGRAVVFKDTLFTSLILSLGSFMSLQLGLYYRKKQLALASACLMLSLVAGFLLFYWHLGRTGQVIFVALLGLSAYQEARLKGLGFAVLLVVSLLGLSAVSPQSALLARWKEAKQSYELDSAHRSQAEQSMAIRLHVWSETWQRIQERPWWGFGTGSFYTLSQQRMQAVHESVYRNPHNQYLNIWVQQGLFALVGFVALLFSLWRHSQSLSDFEKRLLQGLVLSFGLGCLANSWLTDFTSGYLFLWFFSVTMRAQQNRVTQSLEETLPHAVIHAI